jgi:uncharacterized protein (TIGR03435 family)
MSRCTRPNPGITTIVALTAGFALAAICRTNSVRAQTQTADWEKAAGGKMSFDVASVKQNTSGHFLRPNFPLDDGDAYTADQISLSAKDSPLTTYIGFAYKLSVIQRQALNSQLPNWAATERFDIEARAATRSTKDQMRLMMQSLLANRFKLAAHFETQQGPIFALALTELGKTGPQLRPYSDDPPCSTVMPPDKSPVRTMPPKTALDELPAICGLLMVQNDLMPGGQLWTVVERHVTMQQIANDLPDIFTSALGLPVIDETGLSGRFDFTMRINLKGATVYGGPGASPAASAVLDALKDQLGLKLVPATGPIKTLVIDHIEEPAPN